MSTRPMNSSERAILQRNIKEESSDLSWFWYFSVALVTLPAPLNYLFGKSTEEAFWIMILSFFLMVAFGWYHRTVSQDLRKMRADLAEGEVMLLSGEVLKKWDVPVKGERLYFLSVDGVVFSVDRSMYAPLVEGKHIKLYHTPQAKVVVSIEHL